MNSNETLHCYCYCDEPPTQRPCRLALRQAMMSSFEYLKKHNFLNEIWNNEKYDIKNVHKTLKKNLTYHRELYRFLVPLSRTIE